MGTASAREFDALKRAKGRRLQTSSKHRNAKSRVCKQGLDDCSGVLLIRRNRPGDSAFDLDLAYLLTKNLQIAVRANFGLNKSLPNLEAYTGVSMRL